MDNPQHYQPLSHALQPPSTSTLRSHYTPAGHHTPYIQHGGLQELHNTRVHDDEEEEEEEDDDDEGLVEEQLNNPDGHGSGPSSPKGSTTADAHTAGGQGSQHTDSVPEKRRPGRPRGSKNRKPRVSAKHENQFYAGQAAASTPAVLPAHPNVTPQNQPYYEFQWRMLNLCGEFYGAAEELVKATSPLVIAQCYQMGPGIKVDPLTMLAEAKRVCDTLLANPSQLVTNPPPPMYPVLPAVYQPVVHQPPPQPAASSSSSSTPSATATATPSVITGAQSFVVPLGQPGYPPYAVYGTAPQYPTTPYYHQYPAYSTPYYPQPHPVPQPVPAALPPQPVASTSATPALTGAPPGATITTTPATGGTMIGNSGQWSEEESDRLRKLAEENKARSSTGEVDWDGVVQEWGPTRTRHQVLLQANKLGLKESTTRPTKRRREERPSDLPAMSSLQGAPSSTSNAPPTSAINAPAIQASTASPAHSATHSGSTPGASPALQNQARPSSAKGPAATKQMPWPMPTVAVNSPGLPPSSSGAPVGAAGEQQRSSYYRPRPMTADKPTAPSPQQQQQQVQHNPHHYMYTPNGQTASYRPKENGK